MIADHRIVGLAVLVEGKLVEGRAARLASDETMHGVGPMLLQSQAVADRLAIGLNREKAIGISHGEALSIDRTEGKPKAVGFRFGQVELGDIVRRRAGSVGPGAIVQGFYFSAETGKVRDHHVALERALDQQDVMAHGPAEFTPRNFQPFVFLGRADFLDVSFQSGHAFTEPHVVPAQTDFGQNALEIPGQHRLVVVKVQRTKQPFFAFVHFRNRNPGGRPGRCSRFRFSVHVDDSLPSSVQVAIAGQPLGPPVPPYRCRIACRTGVGNGRLGEVNRAIPLGLTVSRICRRYLCLGGHGGGPHSIGHGSRIAR
jgi:hypothetical protein